MQINHDKMMFAGVVGGTATFAAGTAIGIRNAGHRYTEADKHVRTFSGADRGPTNAAEAKRMARTSSSSAKRGAEAIIDPAKAFNLNAPSMRSATAIKSGARIGALTGAALVAGAFIATKLTTDSAKPS